MRFAVQAGGRARTVDVRQHPFDALSSLRAGGYTVTMNGQAVDVHIAPAGPDTWSMLIRDARGAVRSVEAVVAGNGVNGTLDVWINGEHVPVQLQLGLGRRSRMAAGDSGQGPQRLIAPMPGKVVRVLVAPGDEVKARQPLVVVEAMKMENEVRATRDGRVREVRAVEGQSVEAGAVLAVVDQV